MNSFAKFRKERTENFARRYNVDAMILTLPENIYYYTGFFPIGMTILCSTVSYLVVNTHSGQMGLITSAADLPTIFESGYDQFVYPLGNFYYHIHGNDIFSKNLSKSLEKRYNSAGEGLEIALKELVPEARIVAIDEARMSISTFTDLGKRIHNIDFISGTELLHEIRCVKHPQEIEKLRKAVNIAEDAFNNVIKNIYLGMSETEIQRIYHSEIVSQGCNPYFCVITIDKRAGYSDTLAKKWSKVKRGSILRFDFGCIYEHYRSDIARTVIVGQNNKAEDYYAAILEGQNKAINSIKPGIQALKIFDAAINATRASGIPHYQRNHVGHGIGVSTYDFPLLSPTNTSLIKENMVLCVETPYYEIGWGGLQVEDTVLVTKQGAEFLSKSSRELVKIDM